MYDFELQHPIITATERTGYPDGKEPQYPHCPMCGWETDTIYRNKSHEIVGCYWCISSSDAWEEPECFPDKEEK